MLFTAYWLGCLLLVLFVCLFYIGCFDVNNWLLVWLLIAFGIFDCVLMVIDRLDTLTLTVIFVFGCCVVYFSCMLAVLLVIDRFVGACDAFVWVCVSYFWFVVLFTMGLVLGGGCWWCCLFCFVFGWLLFACFLGVCCLLCLVCLGIYLLVSCLFWLFVAL